VRTASTFIRLLVVGAVGFGPVLRLTAKAEARAATSGARSDRAMEFDLPAQSAANALLAFSKQAKVEVLFSFEALRRPQSMPVNGRLEPEDALKKLLHGTGFTARRMGGEKFVITPVTQPTGSIKGKLLTPDGAAAVAVRVALPLTRHNGFTDHAGEFEFPAVKIGTYQFVAAGDGFEPLQLGGLRVAADQTLTLAPQTLRPADSPSQLAAFVVEDKAGRNNPLDHSDATFAPRTATSNLDLARTESDALPQRRREPQRVSPA